jgi:uncharacterized SAM-binding protein YcdF (DUF218 family)
VKSIIALALGIILIIIGVGVYLGPDDLAKCGPKPSTQDGCAQVDGIIAISGGDTSARTEEAIKLYKNGWADTLIFSGAAQDKTGPSNAEAMRRQALDEGVPESAIVLEETSETTHQNAQQTQELLIKYDLSKVILVTSAYHQRRASLEFGERMKGLVKIINHPVAADNQWSAVWWMTPIGWWLALSELGKITAFYMGGSR